MQYPEGTGSLKIQGAVFADGQREVELDPSAPGTLEWITEPHQGSLVRAAEDLGVRGVGRREQRLAGKVILYPPQRAGEQRLAAGFGPEQVDFSTTIAGEADIDLSFAPTLTSKVDRSVLRRGDAFSDVISLRAGADSEHSPWPTRQAGGGGVEFAPVVAEATIYGPFASPQQRMPEPPSGPPVAATARVIAREGPGEYRVEAAGEAAAPGYYSWVWEIRRITSCRRCALAA